MDESYFESEFEGVDPVDPEEIAREVFEELDEDEARALILKLGQDEVNDDRAAWFARYGFDHECSCAQDHEDGKLVKITHCYAGACEDAFDELSRVRAFLYAIATSPTDETRVLKALAGEAFGIALL